MLRLIIVCLPLALGACGMDDNSAAALAVMGGGLQNYGAQRASYQPAYHTALCQPVGRTVMCY